MSDETDEVTEAAAIMEGIGEAKKTFSWNDKLRGFRKRTAKVVLFPDAEIVQRYVDQNNKVAMLAGAVAGSQADDTDQAVRDHILKNHDEADEELERLRSEMLETALSFHMRAVPNVSVKIARREARKKVANSQGTIEEQKQEEQQDYFNKFLLVDVIEKVVDSTGAEARLSLEDLQELSDQVDTVQWDRIVTEMNRLNFIDGLAQQATDDPGF